MITPFRELAKLPKYSGIYFVKDKAGQVLYVGKGRNISSRWDGHQVFKKICAAVDNPNDCTVETRPVTLELLDKVEQLAIATYNPSLNVQKPRKWVSLHT